MSEKERQKCECCGTDLCFAWSDTHGVGCCSTCGLPYTIFHYEDNKRVNKPPSIALNEEGLMLAKRYWDATKRRVFPACYDMGFLSGRECSYSGATQEDCRLFNEWYATQPEVIAAKAQVA